MSPSNLFVCYDGNVQVMDFGIARAAGRIHVTQAGAIKGKLSYMAPDQLRRLEPDRRVDVWSLGVVLWEMLVGKRLFRRETAGDEDWYTLHVTDAADFGGNPWITVSLSGTASAYLNLAGWFDCDRGDTGRSCTVGAMDDSNGPGCRAEDATAGFRLDPECSGTSDDDGILLVRVASPLGGPACDDYQLDVTVR